MLSVAVCSQLGSCCPREDRHGPVRRREDRHSPVRRLDSEGQADSSRVGSFQVSILSSRASPRPRSPFFSSPQPPTTPPDLNSLREETSAECCQTKGAAQKGQANWSWAHLPAVVACEYAAEVRKHARSIHNLLLSLVCIRVACLFNSQLGSDSIRARGIEDLQRICVPRAPRYGPRQRGCMVGGRRSGSWRLG